MSAPRTQRQEDVAAAAAARADADGLAAKREATRAASAAAAAAAARDADCAAARRRYVALAAAVRARSDAFATAWAELEPLLRERARSANVVAARDAAELSRPLAKKESEDCGNRTSAATASCAMPSTLLRTSELHALG